MVMRQIRQKFTNHPDDTFNAYHKDADTSGYQITETEFYKDAKIQPDRSDPPVMEDDEFDPYGELMGE